MPITLEVPFAAPKGTDVYQNWDEFISEEQKKHSPIATQIQQKVPLPGEVYFKPARQLMSSFLNCTVLLGASGGVAVKAIDYCAPNLLTPLKERISKLDLGGIDLSSLIQSKNSSLWEQPVQVLGGSVLTFIALSSVLLFLAQAIHPAALNREQSREMYIRHLLNDYAKKLLNSSLEPEQANSNHRQATEILKLIQCDATDNTHRHIFKRVARGTVFEKKDHIELDRMVARSEMYYQINASRYYTMQRDLHIRNACALRQRAGVAILSEEANRIPPKSKQTEKSAPSAPPLMAGTKQSAVIPAKKEREPQNGVAQSGVTESSTGKGSPASQGKTDLAGTAEQCEPLNAVPTK